MRPEQTEVAHLARRGEFGTEWWARRWLEVLESLGWSSRLQRGRAYAREGRVLEIRVSPGEVTARVQGSRPRPYTVKISVRPLSDDQWERVLDAMAARAAFAARLLAGEMPVDIEEAFRVARCSLFPASESQISTSCSCPDWANPCKHIAAVYYLLGRQFDGDPFLMFVLRGRTREQVLAALRERRIERARAELGAAGEVAAERREPAPVEGAAAASAGVDPVHFFCSPQGVEGCSIDLRPAEVPGVVLRLLGPLAGEWASREVSDAVTDWLAWCYGVAARRALREGLGRDAADSGG